MSLGHEVTKTRRVRLASCLRVFVACLATVGAAQGPETGTVAGTVTLTTKIKGTPLPSTAYPGRTVGDRQPSAAAPELKNVVVYVKDAPFRGALPAKPAELKQEHEAFVPHVLAITRGTTVNFPNADPFFHNVFSLSSAASFNLGRYPPGQSRTQVFNKAGIVKVYCQIHSHMSATILVFDHPYFAIPDVDGTYELTGVPAGAYTVIGWHERVGERPMPVKIERGKTSTVNLSLPLEDLK
jgi:plastocyanin